MSPIVRDLSPDRHPTGSCQFAIVYVSMSAHLLSMNELEHLRKRAEARNVQEDVTGVLLYSDGSFMQYLEGPAPGLSRVYSFIKADRLHYGVVDLLREPIHEREFSGWSMAFRDVGAFGQSSSLQQDALLTGIPATPVKSRSRARELLLNFWSRGRNSAATALLYFSNERARRMAGPPTARK
jgi:hypothetical protein